jgi:tRNA (guanine-N7-)-methyltransferase
MSGSAEHHLDTTTHGLTYEDLPPMPDAVAADPRAAWIDPRKWFADPARRFEIEIGSGKGTFLVQEAPKAPDTNFLGMEYAREFWAYAADRVRRHALDNVRMLYADAAELMHWRMPTGIASVIHLYFPDPWPKTRHHKRRMVSDRFLSDAHRVLNDTGELRIVTDHMDYWAWMEEHFDRWCSPQGVDGKRFERTEFERPASAGEGEVVGTNFERKYRREGRPFNAAILRKV